MDNARELFGRYLDLTPLGSRRSGLVRCIFHGEDRHPSFSVDLDAGVFNCFACGKQGGLKDFAALVGEAWRPASPYAPLATPLAAATKQAERQGRRAAAHSGQWGTVEDEIRASHAEAVRVRALATRLGPDQPWTWDLLAHAAAVERHGHLLEAKLDGGV